MHLSGFACSFVGWIGLIVATATNDWVVTCGYTITTCRKMDELGSKGLWADCVMATGLYHCKPLVDILILPGMGSPPSPIQAVLPLKRAGAASVCNHSKTPMDFISARSVPLNTGGDFE